MGQNSGSSQARQLPGSWEILLFFPYFFFFSGWGRRVGGGGGCSTDGYSCIWPMWPNATVAVPPELHLRSYVTLSQCFLSCLFLWFFWCNFKWAQRPQVPPNWPRLWPEGPPVLPHVILLTVLQVPSVTEATGNQCVLTHCNTSEGVCFTWTNWGCDCPQTVPTAGVLRLFFLCNFIETVLVSRSLVSSSQVDDESLSDGPTT